MKSLLKQVIVGSALGCSLILTGAAQTVPPNPPDNPSVARTAASFSGKVAQLNFDREGEVSGFLLDKNTLVEFPPRAAAVFGGSVHQGDNVQISGIADIAPTGFKAIRAQSVQDRTSGKNFTERQPGAAAPFSGSGRISQLNYAPDGSVNAFLLDNGTLANIAPFGAGNPSSVSVGSAITFAGFARTSMAGRTVVDVQSLTVNGQTVAMNNPAPPPTPRRGRGRRGVAPAPPPPLGTPAPVEGAAPSGRVDQPPPPPPPAQ